jgi:dTDP-4-amino-4,6-dideoxygalactose transaminase
VQFSRYQIIPYSRRWCYVSARDKELFHKLYYSHNFGHNGPLDFHGLGINGKISELQAAMGLAVLPYMDFILSNRKRVVDYYNQNLDFSSINSS